MKYSHFDKSQLITRIEELEKTVNDLKGKRAFSYEDQIKLAILDNSPFSIWTSDRDCKITMWSGQCENMYGYKAKDVIGKNYISTFVAEDERATAAKDHLSIVDDGKPFHNLAQDVHLDGSHPMIMTNCFRIRDPKTGDFWYAEMGLNVEFFNDELLKYRKMVTTSKQIRSSRQNLESYADAFKEQMSDRVNSMIKLMLEGATSAKKLGKVDKYSCDMKANIDKLEQFIDEADKEATNYLTKITSCDVLKECEKIRKEYVSKCNKLDTQFAVAIVDVLTFLQNYDSDNAELAGKREELLKLINEKDYYIKNKILKKTTKISSFLEDLTEESDAANDSSNLPDFERKIEQYSSLSLELTELTNKWREKVSEMSLNDDVEYIKGKITRDYSEIEKKIL